MQETKKATYTPGPWRKYWGRTDGGEGWIVEGYETDRNTRLAVVGLTGAPPAEFEEANARLIAAAPELLEALERMSMSDHHSDVCECRTRARSLIARVKGDA